jgi:methyl-accepting chemotaxis protein
LKLTIGRKILFSYGVAMLFMAATGITAYLSMARVVGANEWVRHTYLVIENAKEVRANLVEIESAYRGYVLTGDERYLDSIKSAQARLAQSRGLLRTLTADNPSEQRRLDVLDPSIEVRLAEMLRISDLRRSKGLAPALAEVPLTNNRERMAQFRNLLGAVEDEENILLNRREQEARSWIQNADRIILYGTLSGFFLTAWMAFATSRSITRPLGEFQHFVASVGEGDLTQTTAREGKDELGRLAHGLNQMVTRIKEMATQTRAATENLAAATMEILASAREQSAVTAEQVAAHQQTNVTIQEVSQSGHQISERAKQVTITAEAVSIANTSGLDAVQKTNQTVEAIHEQAEAVAQNIVSLSEKTQAVGDILATVNDIAEQSHLLALNAAIEAAAAGEHGRSFSVVAGEIKNLADQSKAATVQVKTILGDIQKEINTSVMLTEEAVKRVDVGKHQADVAASAIRNMAANIDQSVQAFQQIVAGTNQQQIGFDNVMQALKDMSRGSEQAITSNRQTEKAAANLTVIGAQLRKATERYRL